MTVAGSVMEEPCANRLARVYAARLLESVIFYALLSLIALTAVPYGTVEEWWESAFQCAVLVLAALWLTEGILSRRWLSRIHLLLIPPTLILALVCAQAVPFGRMKLCGVEVLRTLSADAYETRLVALRLLALLLVAAMLLRYTTEPRRLRALTYTVIFVGLVSALFGVIRQDLHFDRRGFVLPYLRPQMGYGQFINNNHFALLMEMAFGLLLGLLAGAGARHTQRRGRFLYLIAATPIWSALVLANSRGGVFAMMGQVLFFALLLGAARSPGVQAGREGFCRPASGDLLKLRRLGLSVCMLLVVGVSIAWVGSDPLARRMENLQNEVEGAADRRYPRRVEMWRATWKMVKDHPVVGVGFGGYWVAINRYYDASGVSVPQQAHNDYLETLASGGVIAGILVICFVVLLIRQARKCLRAREPFRRAACFGALVGLVGTALHGIVDFGLHVTVNSLVFISLIVLATAQSYLCRDGTSVGERPARHPALYRSFIKYVPQIDWSAARATLFALCLLACPHVMLMMARAGISRWYTTYVKRDYSLTSAEEAVRLSPADPVAHSFYFFRLSENEDKRSEALVEIGRAVALRPEDYNLWMNLGFARQQSGDAAGALDALGQAVRLAPFYAEPHWQLGAQLLNEGRREQAFQEFDRAVNSEPDLLASEMNLAWENVRGDVGTLLKIIQPESQAAKAGLARLLIEHGETAEAMALLRQAGGAAEGLRRNFVADLLSQKRFIEACHLWSGGHRETGGAELCETAVVADGGFEKEVYFEETGFGWRVAKNTEGLSILLDTNQPHSGFRSLLFNFKGDSPARTPLVSQLILVEPNTRYRLGFAARTQGLMTTGPPTVELADAGDGQALTPPTLFTRGNVGWQDYAVEFVTGQATSAVSLTVRRQECPLQPCLIFGRVWLDDFSAQKF
jgi:O-antigen ligase